TSLHVPAQSDLCCALAILFTDLAQQRMCEDSMLTFCERSPRLWLNTVFMHQLERIFLLKERMQLYLIDGRDDFYAFTEIAKTVWIKVADTDGTQLAFTIRFFHCPIS